MKTCGNLCQRIYQEPLPSGWADRMVSGICSDSRRVDEGNIFVAVSGTDRNGRDFVDKAIEQGAKVVVLQIQQPSCWVEAGVLYIGVKDTFLALRQLAIEFYDNPSQAVRVIGITGTNGKTTVAYLIESILKVAGLESGVVGTVNHRVGDKVWPALNTTPGFLDNQEFLARLVDQQVPYAIMEMSSHALHQGRIDEISCAQAIFTNLTQDHLDYHGSEMEYFEAKALLFTTLSTSAGAILNVDDVYGRLLNARTAAQVTTYSIDADADVRACDIEYSLEGSTFTLKLLEESISIKTSLMGTHNVFNILAAATACWREGISLKMIAQGIAQLTFVPGRLERLDYGQPYSVWIDYAHTPDALMQVLHTFKDLKRGRLILVFGCGGDRDQAKRPMMGCIAAAQADVVILTNDNPRTENPQQIIDQIVAGFGQRPEIIFDRREAIQRALHLAQPHDVVLLAGKGHEDCQIIGHEKKAFDEPRIVKELLKCC